MDICEFLISSRVNVGDRVELTGWLVDASDGLYILGDHTPEDIDFPCRVLVGNGNVIYPILEKVPCLGGGWSLLFYRVKVEAVVECKSPWMIRVENILIERDRGSGKYLKIDVSPSIVAAHVHKRGDYKFKRSRDPMRDWLDD
jgi:hypothetical protein